MLFHSLTMAFLVGCLAKPVYSRFLSGRFLDEVGEAPVLGSLLAGCLVYWSYLSAMAGLAGTEPENIPRGSFGDSAGMV